MAAKIKKNAASGPASARSKRGSDAAPGPRILPESPWTTATENRWLSARDGLSCCLRDLLYAPTWTPFYGFPELWRDRWDGSAASETEKGEIFFILFFRLFGRRRRALPSFALAGPFRRVAPRRKVRDVNPPRELDALFLELRCALHD